MNRRLLVHLFGIAIALATAAGSAASDDDKHRDDQYSEHYGERHEDRDHEARERIRTGVERGELKSLAEVLRLTGPSLPGTVVGTEIENKNGVWLYEFRVVDKDGRLFDVYVDAATALISKIKEK